MNVLVAALPLLWKATWVASLAIVVVLLLRRVLRTRFGARIAYAAWLLVPVSMIAAFLPARVVVVPAVPVAALPPAAIGTVVAPQAVAIDPSLVLTMAWGLGVVVCLLWFTRQQIRFQRGLGRLQRLDTGMFRAEACEGLPALVGVLRPRVIVPMDFEERFDADQRALMLAHEQSHCRHGDPWINVLVVLVRCLQWFNPLVHVAASRLRHDQELACDERVVARHPASRRAYGDAMLKTLMAARPVPLGCHWGITHPLKERLMMLKHPRPTRRMRVLGLGTLALAAIGGGFAAWSAQPPRTVVKPPASARVVLPASATESTVVKHVLSGDGKDVQVELTLRMDDAAPRQMTVLSGYGTPFEVRVEENGKALALQGQVQPTRLHNGAAGYRVQAWIDRDGKRVAEPVLVTGVGKPAAIRVGEEQPGGRFHGVDVAMTLRAPDPELLRAIGHASAAAELSAADAERVAREAADAAEHVALTAGDAERIAAQAETAAAAAVRAQIEGAAAQRIAQRARRVADAALHVSAPPMPPKPPAPPPPATVPPPAPPAPPQLPSRHVISTYQQAIAAGGRAVAAGQAGFNPAYRWVEIDRATIQGDDLVGDITKGGNGNMFYMGYRK